jgi:hypothetical protein
MKKLLLSVVVFFLLVSVIGCKGGGTTTPNTSNLTVKVLDEAEKPLANASLDLNGTKGTTSSNGTYVFKNLIEGTYTVDATLEGYNSNSESVDIAAGKDANLTIVLSKTSAESEIKELSSIKSYSFSFITKDKDGKTSTIKSEINDFGKREHLTIINEDNEIETEYYLVNDKAKMKSGGDEEWMELTGEQATSMSGVFTSLAESFSTSAREWYNGAIKTPTLSTTFKKLGTETMNAYSTNKYQYTVEGKALGSSYYDKVTVTYWIINRGDYKDYTTKLFFEYFPVANATGTYYQSIEFNFTKFGEDIDIKLP